MTSVFPNTPFLGGFSRVKFTIVGFCFLQILSIGQQLKTPCTRYMEETECAIHKSNKLKLAAEMGLQLSSDDISCCVSNNGVAVAHQLQETSRRKKRGFAVNFQKQPDLKWSSMPIYYVFNLSSSVPNPDQVKTTIRSAIDYIQKQTCITFSEQSAPPGTPYMKFMDDQTSNCLQFYGRITSGLETQISLNNACINSYGRILLVIGQSLGLLSEIQRPDRDNYIIIKDIPSAYNDQLTKFGDFAYDYGIQYDYSSIMHVPPTWLTTKKSITIQTIDPLYQRTIGQSVQYSFYDSKLLNILYCQGKCGVTTMAPFSTPACQNGGYQDPNNCNRCRCPDGFGGDTCNQLTASDSQCSSQVLTSPSGQIFSPGYNTPAGTYTSPSSCTWSITAPAGSTITLQFNDGFNLFCMDLACQHWVELRIQSDALDKTGPRFCCGDTPQGKFVSTGNKVLVLFRSFNPVASYRGFQLFYSMGCNSWTVLNNTLSYGAVQNPSIYTLVACQDYCINTASCVGLDFDQSVSPYACWIHLNSANLQSTYPATNVYHYVITRSCTVSTPSTTTSPTQPPTPSPTQPPTQSPTPSPTPSPTTTMPTSTTPTTTPTTSTTTPTTTSTTKPTTITTTTPSPVCPFWNVTYNRNSGGGSQASASTLDECKQICADNRDCSAIDFDHSTNPATCWIHNNNDPLNPGNFPGCDQYRIVRCVTVSPYPPTVVTSTTTSTSTSTTTSTTTTTTPTTTTTTPTTTSTTTSTTTTSPSTQQTTSSIVCSTNWNVTEGLHSGNGVKVPGVQTESDCRNYCINMPSCEGVDFVWGASPQECWVHTNFHDFDTLYSDSNVRQIRITNRCTPPTCQTNWITRYGIHSIGAQRVTTDSMVSTSDCLEYCSNNDNCYGVDVDMSASPSPACWVHTNLNDFSALYSDSNVNQYQLSNRCPPTNVTACQNGWVIRNGTHSMGGVKTANPLMTFDCLAYCAANPTCIGVDTNPSKNPPECWVYTDATKLVQKYQDGNMVQYELIARCPNNTLPQNTGGCGGSAATPGQMHPPCMIPRVPASSCDIYNLRLVFMGSAWSLTYIMTHGPCMVPTCNGVTQLINLNGELKCAVQGWTLWTPCSRSCGCGVQYRYYYSVINNMYSTTQQNQQNCNCQRC